MKVNGGQSPDEQAQFVDALAQLSFVVINALADISAEHELSLVQVRMLGVLRDREPIMNSLSRHLGLDKSSVSGLVDRAQRRGLVTRVPSETDRRALRVSITAQGRALADQVAAEFTERVEGRDTALHPNERQAFTVLASRMIIAEARHHGIDLRTGRR
jgi:MarR family transcriptional regulator, lower aerobic nicotinate degradation pathway regulator